MFAPYPLKPRFRKFSYVFLLIQKPKHIVLLNPQFYYLCTFAQIAASYPRVNC